MKRFALLGSRARPHPLRAAVIGPAAVTLTAAPASDDLRMFLTAWVGGLVFFGTLLA